MGQAFSGPCSRSTPLRVYPAPALCRDPESGDRSALRGFVATPGFVLAIAPVFRAAVSGPHPFLARPR